MPLYQRLKLIQTPTPFAATLNVRSSLSEWGGCVELHALPASGSINPTPGHVRGPLELRREPTLNFQTKPDKSARRKRRHARGAPTSKWFPVYPPTPLRNPLDSRDPNAVRNQSYTARCGPPKPWSRWGERRAAAPPPTLLEPSTCPRHRPPPSPSSPVVGARMPRPWLPHLRLRALARLGRRHPLFAAYGAVVAQLQPQPAGGRRRPVPGLSGRAPSPATP